VEKLHEVITFPVRLKQVLSGGIISILLLEQHFQVTGKTKKFHPDI
jgi:hypothetical protein